MGVKCKISVRPKKGSIYLNKHVRVQKRVARLAAVVVIFRHFAFADLLSPLKALIKAPEQRRPFDVLEGAVHDHHRRHPALLQRVEKSLNVKGKAAVVAAKVGAIAAALLKLRHQLHQQIEPVDD